MSAIAMSSSEDISVVILRILLTKCSNTPTEGDHIINCITLTCEKSMLLTTCLCLNSCSSFPVVAHQSLAVKSPGMRRYPRG